MRKIIGLAALGVLVASLGATPSLSQGISIGPGGVRVDPGYRRGPPDDRVDEGIDRRDAIRAARREGIDDIDSVGRRGPNWIVKGTDRRDRDITVILDARTGDVVDVRRF